MSPSRVSVSAPTQAADGPSSSREWRSPLLAVISSLLLFEILTGLSVFLLPFSESNQLGVLMHTAVGLLSVAPTAGYLWRHWRVRRQGNLSHYQLLGYLALGVLTVCVVSGLVLTWQGLASTRMDHAWEQAHLISGVAFVLLVAAHFATVLARKVGAASREMLSGARRAWCGRVCGGTALLLGLWTLWGALYREPRLQREFPADYDWRFGDDRPFAPSLARVDSTEWLQDLLDGALSLVGDAERGDFLAAYERVESPAAGLLSGIRGAANAVRLDDDRARRLESELRESVQTLKATGCLDPKALAGSASCGKSGCHREIYEEWLPSAHRYSSLDDLFQRVQGLMARETSPEQTRYCAGCHDPISLFGGAKSSGNITLSEEGAHEGISCLVCHSIVQADVQGNGDYTVRPARRYVYELDEGWLAEVLSDFLIRTYPAHHVRSYSRPLYKTAEFCAACHKQYVDTEVNTDIGKVQGQNQYDSWKNSRWYREGDPESTIACRECHMPLVESGEPARGDVVDYNRTAGDGKHRSHRMLASNQYIPLLHGLEGADRHVRLTEMWLRGEIEIPEIREKWTAGPVVRMEVLAPEVVRPAEEIRLQVVLTNNKTGHDFPTGPLDMIESWVEIIVKDSRGEIVYHTGGMDDDGRIDRSQLLLKSDGFDRKGRLIDRHNLWDLVGASYKRSMYPGVTDTVHVSFQCPSMARGRAAAQPEAGAPGRRTDRFAFPAPHAEEDSELTVVANLWYRKANPEFLDRIYGADAGVRAPVTLMTSSTRSIRIRPNPEVSGE